MEYDRAERHPSTPEGPLDLGSTADELLAEARVKGPGRTARNLTPGAGAPLSQTLVAMLAGVELDEHVVNGPATLQVLQGSVLLRVGGDEGAVTSGQWTSLPRGPHGVAAVDDTVLLLTVAPTADQGSR